MRPPSMLTARVVLLSAVLCLLTSASAGAQTPPTNGLIAYYPFAGNANDASGNGHHGTLRGTTQPTLTADRFGTPNSAYFFPNAGDIGLGSIGPRTGTWAAWVKRASTSGNFKTVVAGSQCSSAFFGVYTNNNLGLGGQCNTPFVPVAASNLANLNWHHIVGTYDGSRVKLYIDGVLKTDVARSGLFRGNDAIGIGGNAGEYFHGTIDEVYIYNRALSASEVTTLFNAVSIDSPPVADAGDDFSVNEGQLVTLDGTGSSDPDGDAMTYAWEQVVDNSPAVMLSGADTAHPAFTAPTVAAGGETLTFRVAVTANGKSASDEVSVTVVNQNHPPVALAGDDQSVAEGALVALDGASSFDVDGDQFTYTWVQVANGAPSVALTGADSAYPTFSAPIVNAGGSPGVVATLVFELRVDDGFPADVPAPGYALGNVVDTVTIEVTNVNNLPTAEAGEEQTVDENSPVSLNAANSSDPDSDPLTFTWIQTGGEPVVLDDVNSAAPAFTTPFVSPGGANLTFEVTVDDGYGGTASDTVVVHVQNANDPPDASLARPTVASLWPPNHQMVAVGIVGVADPDSNATLTITGVTQDEPTMGLGDGDRAVDAVINADGTVLLRSERSGNGDGRVYHIHFTASDYEGSTSGVVTVSVPHSPKKPVVDGGELY